MIIGDKHTRLHSAHLNTQSLTASQRLSILKLTHGFETQLWAMRHELITMDHATTLPTQAEEKQELPDESIASTLFTV